MRIVFTIEVGVDVASYKEAGKILDRVTNDLEESVGDKGRYDIGNFQTRHRNVRDFENQAMMVEAREVPRHEIG